MEAFDFSFEVRLYNYQLFERLLTPAIPELLETLNQKLIEQGILPEITIDYSVKKQACDVPSEKPLEDNHHHNMIDNNQSHPIQDEHYNAESSLAHLSTVQPQANHFVPKLEPSPISRFQIPPQVATNESNELVENNLNRRYLDLAKQLSAKLTMDSHPTESLSTNNTNTNESLISEQSIKKPTHSHSSESLHQSTNNTLTKTSISKNHQPPATNNLYYLKQAYAHKEESNSPLENTNSQYQASTDQLIDALNDIKQSQEQSVQDTEMTESIQKQLKHELLSHTDQAPEETDLVNDHLYLVDMIEDLFHNISENKSLSTTAKQLFQHLIIPIIHLALIDETFIEDMTHSARQFLEEFAETSLGITDLDNHETQSDGILYLKLQQISTQLKYEQKINNAVFCTAHEELKTFINLRKTQANSYTPSVKASINKKINAIFDHCLKDKKLPKGIILILNKIWKNVMVNIYLDNNCDQESREKSIAFINSLIFSIQPAKNSLEKYRLERLIPVLNKELKKGLIRINCPDKIQQKMALYLNKLHQSALDSSTKTLVKNKEMIEESFVYRNELFDDSIYKQSPSQETEIIQHNTTDLINNDDLILIDDNMQSTITTKIVNSLKEAFIEQDETHTLNQIPTSQSETHIIERCSSTDFELIRLASNSYKTVLKKDGHTQQAKNLQVDVWLEFRFKNRYSRAQITYIEDDHSQFNFLTQNNRIIELSLESLSDSFRQNICSIIESNSIIDEAIQATLLAKKFSI
jgi:hypothetical protein